MIIQRKQTATKSAPQAIGPYSQAIVAGGLVYCSGQVGFDPKTMQITGKDVAEQTTRVLENLKAVLIASGSDLSRVLKCTVFLQRMEDFSAMNEVYAQYFNAANAPARSTVAVAALPKNALVEIDCIALASDDP